MHCSTKYDLGDRIYTFHKNDIISGRIVFIIIKMDMSPTSGKINKDIKYNVDLFRAEDKLSERVVLKDEDMFKSKEAILEYLKKRLEDI